MNATLRRRIAFAPEDPHPFTAFHTALLSVRVRRTVRRYLGVAPHEPEARLPSGVGVGLRALHQLDRAGLVRSVVPLKVSPADEVGSRALGALARLAISRPAEAHQWEAGPLAGGSLVELYSEEDADWLRRRLAEDPDVESVSRVPLRHTLAPALILAAPPAVPNLWNLTAIDWAAARAIPGFQDAEEQEVAILDSGIDEAHPDLESRIAHYVHTYPHPVNPVSLQAADVLGHGTHVAGTVAARAATGYGVNGLCAAQIHAYKVFRDHTTALTEVASGNPFFSYVSDPQAYLLALDDCLRRRIGVVNLSLGGAEPPEPNEAALLEALLRRGTVLVSAMGNEGRAGSPASYPAATAGVIAVGASRQDDRIAEFSSHGPHISLCAPGASIWSTLPTYPGHWGFRACRSATGCFERGAPLPRETDYDAWAGTSMAAAHVSGAVALLLANRGTLDPVEVKRRLEMTAGRVPGMGSLSFHPAYGHGRLSLRRLLMEEYSGGHE